MPLCLGNTAPCFTQLPLPSRLVRHIESSITDDQAGYFEISPQLPDQTGSAMVSRV